MPSTPSATSSARWLRILLSNRRLHAALGVLLVLVASVGVGGVLLRRAHAAPTTRYVATSGADTGDCSVPATPCKTITYALGQSVSGDTINVAAGSYGPSPCNATGTATSDQQVFITIGITLQGVAGSTTLSGCNKDLGAPSNACVVCVTNPTGDVTVTGFTFEGDNADNQAAESIVVNVEQSAHTVTFSNDDFFNSSTIDPTSTVDLPLGFYAASGTGQLNLTNNTFDGLWQGTLIEGEPGPTNVSGNTYQNLIAGTISSVAYWAEGLVYLVHGNGSAFDVTSTQSITGNTFKNYDGLGFGLDAGYGPETGSVTGMTVSGNTFDIGGATDPNQGDSADIFFHAQTSSTPDGSFSNATIQGNTLNLSSTGNGYGISLEGNIGTGNVVDHNVLLGSGTSLPPGGIRLFNTVNTPGVTITNNLITQFVNGLDADNLAASANISASQNCIYHNATNGAVNGSGAGIAAANNWWGTPNGPLGPGNPTGTGNPVSSNITFLPFLGASIPSICAAPTTTLTIGNPQVPGAPVQVSTATPLTLTAIAGYQPVGSIHYRFYPAAGTPPAFTVVNGHTASFMLSGANGTYVVEWYAVDVTTNEEVRRVARLALTTITPGLDVNNGAAVPQSGSPDTGPASPANDGTGTTGNVAGTNSTASQPAHPAAHAATQPARGLSLSLWELLGAGGLLLLVVLGGVGFLLVRSRRQRGAQADATS